MARLGPFEPAPRLAAGVSGGADSMALALLADVWARERGGALLALIVDHGLRAEFGKGGGRSGDAAGCAGYRGSGADDRTSRPGRSPGGARSCNTVPCPGRDLCQHGHPASAARTSCGRSGGDRPDPCTRRQRCIGGWPVSLRLSRPRDCGSCVRCWRWPRRGCAPRRLQPVWRGWRTRRMSIRALSGRVCGCCAATMMAPARLPPRSLPQPPNVADSAPLTNGMSRHVWQVARRCILKAIACCPLHPLVIQVSIPARLPPCCRRSPGRPSRRPQNPLRH